MDSPAAQLDNAIAEINREGCEVVARSSFYRTPCFPAGAGPDFVNAAICCKTSLSPAAMMEHLHRIEARAGRQRTQRWQPRVLDLDLLAWGQAVLPDMATYQHWATLAPRRQQQVAPEELILPHPRLHERGFVIVPLMDIAPDWMHPVLGTSVRQMHSALDPADLAQITPISAR